MRIIRTLPVLTLACASAIGVTFEPARATYCGEPADTAAIERLITSTSPHLDRTYIGQITVAGRFAQAGIDDHGTYVVSFIHRARWHAYGGSVPPSIAAEFLRLQRAHHDCTNPNVVNHPSG